MKTNLIVLLLTLIWLNGFSQAEFAPIGSEWYYSQYESYNPPQANFIKHTCIKDSTIEGKMVKVIQKTKFKRSGATNLGYEYLYQHGDTISYWKNGEFHVLYNFSLSNGDSMLLYSEMPDYCENKNPYGWVEIGSVHTTTINNHVLRAYGVTPKKGSTWDFGIDPIIEKIGSIYYLIPQNYGCIVDQPGIGSLRCYSDPELGVFHYQYEDLPCDTITTFPDGVRTFTKSSPIKLYPNPVVKDLIIECKDKRNSDYILNIFDLSGKLVQSQNFCPGKKIDLSFLHQGLFQITIYNNTKLVYHGTIYKK